MKERSQDFSRKRIETRTEPNPFIALDKRKRAALVSLGIVAEAAKLGAGRHHKASYSRTFAGRLKQANIEVVFHLRTAAAKLTRALSLERRVA